MNSFHLPQQQLSCTGIPGGTSHLARTEPLTDGTEPRAQQEGLGDGSGRLEALRVVRSCRGKEGVTGLNTVPATSGTVFQITKPQRALVSSSLKWE